MVKYLTQISMIENFLARANRETLSKSSYWLTRNIQEGRLSAAKTLLKIKLLTEELERIRAKIMPLAIDEVSNFGGKEVPLYGGIFTVKEAGTKWDFTACQLPLLDNINIRALFLAAEEKKYKETLKAFAGDPFLQSCITSDGEEIKREDFAKVPTKRSTTIVEVKIPQN